MRIPQILSLLLILPGCGLLLGECISAPASGEVQDQAGDGIDGAEISECEWDDCSSFRVIGVTESDGSFNLEVASQKSTLGGCQSAWIRVAATGCTPQEMQAEQFQAPIVLDCSGR